MTRSLTERDWDTLDELRAATDNHLNVIPENEGWVMPMDCGGSNGSHHSYTLRKLSDRGLCERKKYGGAHQKGSCRYRINAAGRHMLSLRVPVAVSVLTFEGPATVAVGRRA